MKIFISYGHNDHTQVVDLLFDALIREGHEPWKDDRYEGTSGIPAGRDFTELIYQTIDASDFVIAFVTNQTKDKPYCRDERQRAYNSKGNHFIQIRMDYADITLGNASSYIDMSDVIGSNGQINQSLFEDKLKALFAAFRDPASFAEGGFTPWAKFDTHLKVPGALKYHDFIASLDGEDFVGRQWLLEKCKTWAMDSDIPCRLFVILGEAGTGKTAFIRRLASDAELVRSVHICVYDKPSTRTAKDTLKDLAYVLAQNNTRYFDYLKMRDFEQLRDMTTDGLFEFLFIEPLKTETQKYLLVIDGLDEMEETTGFKPLMRLFRQYAHQMNPNISFLVTGRPDAYITDMLKTVAAGKPMESVLLDKNVSKEDLQHFITSKLEKLGCYSENLADKLLDACDGNFEYLSLLFREALEEGLRVFEGMKIPRGLNERYAQYLDRRMEMADCNRLSRDQRKLLSILCAAYEPLPIPVLCAITNLEDYDISDELELFGSLIRHIGGKDPRICLFTKSFRDFLLGKHFEKYCADHKLGTRLFAQYLIDRCPTEKALEKHAYLDQYGFVHLLRYAEEDPDAVVEYCNAFEKTGADLSQRIADALHLGDTAALHNYWEIRKRLNADAVVSFLKGKRSLDALTEIIAMHKSSGALSYALSLEADIMLWNPTPEVTRQAEDLFRQAMELDEAAHNANPSIDSRRDLIIDYMRIGDMAQKKQTPEGEAEAETWYLKAANIAEEVYKEAPRFSTRRSLASNYVALGDLLRQKQIPESTAKAEEWFLKALELYEENIKTTSNYQSRRGLAINYMRLGDLCKRKQTPEGFAQAEEWYRKATPLYEENLADNANFESRRGLSINYARLGDLAKQRQTLEGNRQAEAWYRKSIEIDELNYQSTPCYQSRRDLSISYAHLGDIFKRKETPEGNEQTEYWYQKSLEMDTQNHQTNPNYQSRRDLAFSYDRLGNLTVCKQTQEAYAQAEQYYKKALALYKQNFADNPCIESRRDVSCSYTSLGDIEEKKQTSLGDAMAVQWYQQALEMDEAVYKLNPNNTYRRSLAIDYARLGNMAMKQNTTDGFLQAEEYYRKALQWHEECLKVNPTYATRRSVALSLSRLGDLEIKKPIPGSYTTAISLYRRALELDEENYASNPCPECRTDVAVDARRLANAIVKWNAPNAAAEAEPYYAKALEMSFLNYQINPTYQHRRGVSLNYNYLGDLARDQMTPEGNAKAEEYYLKMLEMDKKNYEINPCSQSRKDLTISYGRLKNIAERMGNKEKAQQWANLKNELTAKE